MVIVRPFSVDSIVVVTTLLVGLGGGFVVVPSLVVGDGSFVVAGVVGLLLLVELAGGGNGEEPDSADAKQKELFDKAQRGGWAGYIGRWGRGDWSESSGM